ncbi:murein transglycosylase A [Caulobacter mirabilis]|uniref:peptidoglycan lytic exotransglycosylase n=1 Tax=Caulobacter mirabilis TaxID=69666 RepID=A0A2D2B307_9CAUL|nr:MltA domain-containing protein [Caulobacter mirabilis]ATQ44640.1 transglycosylase [Caulobacter mirabilis]
MRFRVLGAALALVVAACATPKRDGPLVPPPKPRPIPEKPVPPPPPPPTVWLPFSELPGWDREDHLAALEAFKATCGVARDPAVNTVCRKARQMPPPDDQSARAFLEENFRATPIGGDGLLTAYFAPVYEARISNRDGFSAPVMAKPDDLVLVDPAELDSSAAPGPRIPARLRGGKAEAYPDRATIEAEQRGVVLAWMRPEDLFFLQIQGSGVLTLPDGRRKRVAFAAHNGRPFVGIAKPLRERGLLADNNTSGDSIKRWLAEHRGPEAEEIMRLNPRYVFFSIADDDGREPAGAAGVPLPPGRAIAVDNSRHSMGELFWIDASAPVLTDAFPVYRRLAVALDTGGAIKGEVRADLYMGKGDAAGAEAGRVRHTLRMYRLAPIGGS